MTNTCPRCSTREIGPADNFCKHCGLALKVEAAAATTATGWGIKPFRPSSYGSGLPPKGMTRKRGEANYSFAETK